VFYRIKNKVEQSLVKFAENINRGHKLKDISPLLHKRIKEFILRTGKRIRPILLVIGYLGFTKKPATGLYNTAVSIELFHDFMLIHDDIIDKSETRRNKPSMHALLNEYLKGYQDLKFTGEDLSIIVGDIIYALAIDAFLSIKEKPARKEKALRNFIRAAMLTGSGEFIELLSGKKDIDNITRNQIYRIYDYKTAFYTFACPLSTGAILAGASKKDLDKLYQLGMSIGRAFQIKDDILGLVGDEKKIGKSTLTDLQEAKKTLLLWYAYRKTNKQNKKIIRQILKKEKVNKSDLKIIINITEQTGALEYAKNEILSLLQQAYLISSKLNMHKKYKSGLLAYVSGILRI